MLVKSDERDVVFFTGGGEHGGWENKGNPPCSNPPPAAVKFAFEGEALRATVLWSGIDGKSAGECHAGIVYANGKLYHPGGIIIDAATGKVLTGKFRDRFTRATPSTRHLLWIAGNRIVGVMDDKAGAMLEVYDLDGKKVSSVVLPVVDPTGERLDRVMETTGGARWGFSYGCPFTVVGERVYVRSNDDVICLGAK
jgi:hypothetical protein